MIAERLKARLSRRPTSGDYLLALVFVGAALLVRALLGAVVAQAPFFIVLFPAVVLAGVFCGTAPSVVAASVGGTALAGLFVGPQLLAWPPFNATQIGVLMFVPGCALVLWASATLRRFAQSAAQAEARLAEVFRQIPGAAAILQAPDGRLLLRSAQSDTVLGQREKRLEKSGELASYGGIHPDGRRFLADDYPIVRALKTGEVVAGEQFRYRRPDGEMADLEVYAGPVRDAAGAVVAAVGMAFDVSEKVAAERRLRDSEAVHRATAERLQAAMDARDVLMHEADHRIKNSLQLVVALLRLQIGRIADADAKTALRAAMARVDAVADAHLALQQSPDLRTVELGRMLAELCVRVGSLHPNVATRHDTGDGLPLDAERAIPLGLIASELLTNALRHAFPAGRTGTVALTLTVADGALAMTIADDGMGLPPTTGRAGLGTSVVDTLARQIGATVTRRSKAGEGTTILVRLTLAGQAAADRPAAVDAGAF
jgi:PAS domain S-box-containing protein